MQGLTFKARNLYSFFSGENSTWALNDVCGITIPKVNEVKAKTTFGFITIQGRGYKLEAYNITMIQNDILKKD